MDPFYEEAPIQRCALVFKLLNNNLPVHINDLLVTNSHGRNTRFCQLNLRCPSYNRESEGGKTFSVRTAKFWNSLNISCKTSESLTILKSRLFNKIFARQKIIDNFLLVSLY